MPFFVVELHSALWAPTAPRTASKAPTSNGWRMFAECRTDSFRDCTLLFSDLQNFSFRARKELLSFLEYLHSAGSNGIPWATIFQDGKQFHPVHSFQATRIKNGKSSKCKIDVFQFKKKRTDIRVLFIQSDIGKLNLFITHAFEKDAKETPAREKNRAETVAQAFLSAIDTGSVQLISDQGGASYTPNFF